MVVPPALSSGSPTTSMGSLGSFSCFHSPHLTPAQPDINSFLQPSCSWVSGQVPFMNSEQFLLSMNLVLLQPASAPQGDDLSYHIMQSFQHQRMVKWTHPPRDSVPCQHFFPHFFISQSIGQIKLRVGRLPYCCHHSAMPIEGSSQIPLSIKQEAH